MLISAFHVFTLCPAFCLRKYARGQENKPITYNLRTPFLSRQVPVYSPALYNPALFLLPLNRYV